MKKTPGIEPNDKHEQETKGAEGTSRRSLMKKALYTAPVLVSLGAVSKIHKANAFSCDIGDLDPPCEP